MAVVNWEWFYRIPSCPRNQRRLAFDSQAPRARSESPVTAPHVTNLVQIERYRGSCRLI